MSGKKKQKRRTPYPVDWQCRAVLLSAQRSDDDWDAICKGRSTDEAAAAFANDFLEVKALEHGEGFEDFVEVRKLSTTHTTRIARVKVKAKFSIDWEGEEIDESSDP